MINKEYLHSLGFTGFEHLEKEKRDCKDRLTWTGFLSDIGVTVLLVYNNQSWDLDKLILHNEKQTDDLKSLFSTSLTVDEIIEAISSHGALWGVGP